METLNNLTQLNKVPLSMTLEGLEAVQQGRRADDIGLQELMRKQAYETQMDPLRVAHQQLVNKGLTLGNEKTGYELASLGRKDRMETELWDQKKATELQKLLASEGEAAAKVFTQNIYSQLRTTKPGSPQYKALMGALATTQDWVTSNRDQQYKLAQIEAQGRQQQKLAELRKPATPSFDVPGILRNVMSGKLNYEKAATMFETAAAFAQDEKEQVLFRTLAQRFGQAVLDKRPVKLEDVIDMSQLGVPTKTPTQAAPQTNLGASAGAASAPTRKPLGSY